MKLSNENQLLGDYILSHLIAKNSLSNTWLAEQTSVTRRVLVDELRPECFDKREDFLAEVRTKAAVDHPSVASVYEASLETERCYFAYEFLPGTDLATCEKNRRYFQPVQLSLILRKISEAEIYHESSGHATLPLELNAVFVDTQAVVRLKNLTTYGDRRDDESARDILFLGASLVPLVAINQPGSTRLLTLLSWMRGEGLDAPIRWDQVRDYCGEIDHQLAELGSSLSPTKRGKRAVRNHSGLKIALAAGVVIFGIVGIAYRLHPPAPPRPSRTPLPDAVAVVAGKHPSFTSVDKSLPAFRISANEITISQYAEFLETLGILSKEKRERSFDSADQPAEKTSHVPTDWSDLFAAAQVNGIWQNQSVTLDSPVVGVDWWDASAYAEWKKARLPTQEQWMAALISGLREPEMLPKGPWISVTSHVEDRTPTGILGMAGSVSEWTSRRGTNPANPLGEPLWVIVGGSYLKQGSNALTCEWTQDRSLRRSDLGFRIVFDGE